MARKNPDNMMMLLLLAGGATAAYFFLFKKAAAKAPVRAVPPKANGTTPWGSTREYDIEEGLRRITGTRDYRVMRDGRCYDVDAERYVDTSYCLE